MKTVITIEHESRRHLAEALRRIREEIEADYSECIAIFDSPNNRNVNTEYRYKLGNGDEDA